MQYKIKDEHFGGIKRLLTSVLQNCGFIVNFISFVSVWHSGLTIICSPESATSQSAIR
jgi:hypothetical protein